MVHGVKPEFTEFLGHLNRRLISRIQASHQGDYDPTLSMMGFGKRFPKRVYDLFLLLIHHAKEKQRRMLLMKRY